MAVDATNPDVSRNGETVVPRGTVHIFDRRFCGREHVRSGFESITIGRVAMDFSFSIEFDADFADIFELRGTTRERRGRRLETEIAQDKVVLAYEGLDRRLRRTRIVFDPPPTRLSESAANYQIRLEPGEDASYRWVIACEVDADSRGTDQALL